MNTDHVSAVDHLPTLAFRGTRIGLKVSDGRDPSPNVSVRLAPGQWRSAKSVRDSTWE